MDLMREFPDNHFELAIVDPPYGIDINSSGRCGHYGGKGKKWDSETPNKQYFEELLRVSKNQIIWGGNYFELTPCKCFLIWDKQQPEGVSFASCEFAWTNFDSVAKTFYQSPINADGKNGRIHPTQKPVALYRWLLHNYAKPGDKILDTHLGSGSIAIACHEKGFALTGSELDADYFAAMQARLQTAMAQQALDL